MKGISEPVLFLISRLLVPRRLHFTTIITLLASLGIVVGTAATICVVAIFNGFSRQAQELMLGVDPHLRVVPESGDECADAKGIITQLLNTPNVVSAWPATEVRVAAAHQDRGGVVNLLAIADTCMVYMEGYRNSIIYGHFMIKGVDGIPSGVIGASTAERMNAWVGDTILLYSFRSLESALTTSSLPTPTPVVVRGVYHTAIGGGSEPIVVEERGVRGVVGRHAVPVYNMKLTDYRLADEARSNLETRISCKASILTWYDIRRGLYDIMKLERLASILVIGFVIVTGAFNILISLSLNVIEQGRSIAILKTMGMRARSIGSLFAAMGSITGVGSALLGAIVGTLLCLGQQHFSWITFDDSFGLVNPAIPVLLSIADVLLIAGGAIILSLIASVVPARQAYNLSIVSGLRR